jgi:hypothetical protein
MKDISYGYVSSGRCEKIDLEKWTKFGLKEIAPGCLISDRWACGIHFGSNEIFAKSIFSHLPVPWFPVTTRELLSLAAPHLLS